MYVIVWSGLGWLVVAIVAVCMVGFYYMTNALFGNRYYADHFWPIGVALIAAAPINWLLATYLQKRNSRCTYDYGNYGNPSWSALQDGGNHTLFFIPMQIWSPILVGGGLVLCAADVLKLLVVCPD